MTDATEVKPGNGFGTAGFLFGAMALVLVLVVFVAGPFAPQPTTGATIGEIAGEAGKGMLRNWLGMEQPTTSRLYDIDDALQLGVIIAGALAILLGLFAILRGERWRIAAFAIGLGVSSVAVQLLAMALGMILGALVICAVILAIASVFGGGL